MTQPTPSNTPHYLSDEEIPKEIFEGECCCTHDVIHGYRHGFVDGYAAAIEAAAGVASKQIIKRNDEDWNIIETWNRCAKKIARSIRKLG